MGSRGRRKPGERKDLDLPAHAGDRIFLEPINDLFGQLARSHSDHKLDRAQEIAFQAMDAGDRRTRIRLAKRALSISPICSDGYLVLAGEAESLDEAISLYRQAVAAGRKALGPSAFQEDQGAFWALIETRPIMRAMQHLGLALENAGQAREACEIYREMLLLNPNDNQGIRLLLLTALVARGETPEAARLARTYKEDDSAEWLYSVALLHFREKGDAAAARKALKAAFSASPFVPGFLLGRRPLPETDSPYVEFGSAEEAAGYARYAAAAWAAVPGALAWLAAAIPSIPE